MHLIGNLCCRFIRVAQFYFYTRVTACPLSHLFYIPMPHGFMYLYSVIDVYRRFIVGWRLSNSLSASNCIALIEDCIEQYGAPEIVNSDPGVQYTCAEWERALTKHDIAISMDGKGRCKDNIWIERFWRTIKQENIYLHPIDDVRVLMEGIRSFIEYYNRKRPHQGIGNQLPSYRYAA